MTSAETSSPSTVELPSTTVAQGPPASLAPTSGPDGKFIDVDAQDFCNLKNQTFSSQEAITKALQDLLSTAGITQPQWDDYSKRKATNLALRQQGVDKYLKLCP